MRNLYHLDPYRVRTPEILETFGSYGDGGSGLFELPSPIDGRTLCVVASTQGGWDHVSVSRQNRCPNWPEMEHVRNFFFQDDEWAMQLHVPASEHINYHPHCLHMWRPHFAEIPKPPAAFVGPRTERKNS